MGWRKAIFTLCCLSAGALPLMGQGTTLTVYNRQGWTMAGAIVAACSGTTDPGTGTIPCTPQATIYTDATLTTPCTNIPASPPVVANLGLTSGAGCTNPGLTDSHGNARVFINSFFWAQVSGYQVVPQTFPESAGGGGGGGTGCIISGIGQFDVLSVNPLGTCYGDGHFLYNGSGSVTIGELATFGEATHTGVAEWLLSNGTNDTAGFTFSLDSGFTTTGSGFGWALTGTDTGGLLTGVGGSTSPGSPSKIKWSCKPSNTGDFCYWNGTMWAILSGNISGAKYLQNSSGTLSWQTVSLPVGTTFSSSITDIAPVSGDAVLIVNSPLNATLTSFICGTQSATSAVVDLKPASQSAWGTLGSSVLSAPITAIPGGASGTITTSALALNTPLMVSVGTVTGTVNNLYCTVTYTRGF